MQLELFDFSIIDVKKKIPPSRLVLDENGNKKCVCCNVFKPLSDFHKRGTGKIGVVSKCKICVKRKYHLKRINKRFHWKQIELWKKCTLCNQENPWTNFRIDKQGKGCRSEKCKDCNKIDYYKNHDKQLKWSAISRKRLKETKGEQVKRYFKEYSIKNREKLSSYGKEYRAKNAEYLKTQKHERQTSESGRAKARWRYHNIDKKDPRKMIERRLRHTLVDLIRRSKAKKYHSALKLVGCSWEHLEQHLKSTLKEGMKWEDVLNGKLVNIEHKSPCCVHDLTKEDEQLKCFHWSNLELLWATDNQSKAYQDKMRKRALFSDKTSEKV